MQLDAYIICRNEAVWLPLSLASIYDLCDRIFVVDNGSTDGSAEIAEAFNHPGDKKVTVLSAPGFGFADPNMGEVDLRNIGIKACLDDGADMILRWDADEILYEKQEQAIRALWDEERIGAWKFNCHRLVGSLDWVQDLRRGEKPHYCEEGSYDLPGYERQSGQGKLVLFRTNPQMRYVANDTYQGLHSSEMGTVIPHSWRSADVWYVHAEYCRSNQRLYKKAMLYYDLVSDLKSPVHTKEFRDAVDTENVFTPKKNIHAYWRIRPFGLRFEERSLPIWMNGFELPVKMKIEKDPDGRFFIKTREWFGDHNI